MQEGIPNSAAFMPTRKDEGKLSLDRSTLITAKQSQENFRAQGLNSAAVYGITPEECRETPEPIGCLASPLENNPHHSHADFSELSKGQRKTKSQELLRRAIARGKLHP